jgi:hypothetical protein
MKEFKKAIDDKNSMELNFINISRNKLEGNQ